MGEWIQVTPAERRQLEQWASSSVGSKRLAKRARIVLALADGYSDRESARLVGAARQTVALWRRRVLSAGSILAITMDAPGRGRKPLVPAATREAVRRAWLESQRQGTQRSVRDLARAYQMSPATVHRTIRGLGRAAPGAAGEARFHRIERAADGPGGR